MTKLKIHIEPAVLHGPEAELFQLASDYCQSYDKSRGLYRQMVAVVRENQLLPDRVSAILEAAGFNQQNASDVRRIADSDEETYSQYQAGLGFKATLYKIRESAPLRKKRGVKASKTMPIFRVFAKYANKTDKPNMHTFMTAGGFGLVIFPLWMGDVGKGQKRPESLIDPASGRTVVLGSLQVTEKPKTTKKPAQKTK